MVTSTERNGVVSVKGNVGQLSFCSRLFTLSTPSLSHIQKHNRRRTADVAQLTLFSQCSAGAGSLSLYSLLSSISRQLDVNAMLSTLLIILTSLSLTRAAAIAINSTVVCSAGQCIQGFTNTTSTQRSPALATLTDTHVKLAPYYRPQM